MREVAAYLQDEMPIPIKPDIAETLMKLYRKVEQRTKAYMLF